MCCYKPLSVSKAIPVQKRLLLIPAMTGIFHVTLTVWGPKEGKVDLKFDMEAARFNDALKRAFELKNVVREKTVLRHQKCSFRMWPHPHDIIQGWENGQDFIDVVSEVIPGHDAPDESNVFKKTRRMTERDGGTHRCLRFEQDFKKTPAHE